MTLNLRHRPATDSILAHTSPVGKLLGLIVFCLCIVFLQHGQTILLAFGASCWLIYWAKPARSWYIERLLILLVGLLPFLLLVPWTISRGVVLWEWSMVRLTSTGLLVTLQILFKTVAIFHVGMTLLATTEMHHIWIAARKLYVPGVLIQILAMSYRYVFLYIEEVKRLRIALRLRGFRNQTRLRSYQTVGQVVSTLVVRGADRGERVAQAMRCRGYDGTFHTLTHFPITAWDVLLTSGLILLALGCVVWDLLLSIS